MSLELISILISIFFSALIIFYFTRKKYRKYKQHKSMNLGNTYSLFIAIKQGNLEYVKELVKKDINTKHVNANNDNALTYAAIHGQTKILKYLLEPDLNIDINHRNNQNENLFDILEKKNQQILIEYIINLKSKGKSPIITCIELNAKKHMLRIAEQHLNDTNRNNDNALFIAIKQGNLEYVKELIKKDINTKHVNANHDNALTYAAIHGQTEILKDLLEPDLNIDVNHRNNQNENLFDILEKKNQQILIEEIIDLKSKEKSPIITCIELNAKKHMLRIAEQHLNDTNANNDNALFIAIKQGNLEYVTELIKKGINTKHVNANNDNALTYAAIHNQADIARYLLNTKCIETNHKNNQGLSAIKIAAQKKHYRVFFEIMAAHKHYRSCGDSAMMLAIKARNVELVKILSQDQDMIHNKNNDGQTALIIALETNNFEIAKILIDNGALYNERCESIFIDMQSNKYTEIILNILHDDQKNHKKCIETIYQLSLIKNIPLPRSILDHLENYPDIIFTSSTIKENDKKAFYKLRNLKDFLLNISEKTKKILSIITPSQFETFGETMQDLFNDYIAQDFLGVPLYEGKAKDPISSENIIEKFNAFNIPGFRHSITGVCPDFTEEKDFYTLGYNEQHLNERINALGDLMPNKEEFVKEYRKTQATCNAEIDRIMN